MIDYEDIDTPTWIRERAGLPPGVIERVLWGTRGFWWSLEAMGTWEVHDESAILTPSQFRKLHERASDQELATRYACENIKGNKGCTITVTQLGMPLISYDQAKMTVKQ